MMRVTLLVALALASAVDARSLTASDPKKPEFVFSNELLANLASNPPKTSAPLPTPTPGGRAGARVVPVSVWFWCVLRDCWLALTLCSSARTTPPERSH